MSDVVQSAAGDVGKLGPKPRLEFHSPDRLIIDERYQRSVSGAAGKKLIRRILNNFYWPYFGVIVATDNGDGTFCVIDGQHRAEAARLHPGVHSVPVMVIEEMSLAEQAQAFVAINEGRVRLNGLQIHRAAVKAGDEKAIKVDHIATEAGVRIPGNNISSKEMKPGETLAVKSLYWIFETFGGDRLRWTLTAAMRAYGDTAGDLRAQVLKGLAIAIGSAPSEVDRIAATLGEVDAETWEQRGRDEMHVRGGNTAAGISRLLLRGVKRP